MRRPGGSDRDPGRRRLRKGSGGGGEDEHRDGVGGCPGGGRPGERLAASARRRREPEAWREFRRVKCASRRVVTIGLGIGECASLEHELFEK